LIVAQVYLATGGSVYAVTEELPESRLYAEETNPRCRTRHRELPYGRSKIMM
jgi:hypothetical protein